MEESKKGVSRGTLKLKTPATRIAAAPKGVARQPEPVTRRPDAVPRRSDATTRRPDASSWADEHKHRMQADMDALGFTGATPTSRERRG
jgi:hypothetical protein